jgi:hypothetical protein
MKGSCHCEPLKAAKQSPPHPALRATFSHLTLGEGKERRISDKKGKKAYCHCELALAERITTFLFFW